MRILVTGGAGYLGSVLGGYTVARASVDYGWGVVFMALAVVSLIAAVGAGYLFRLGDDAAARHEPMP